jgi:DNA-binding NtrC family response regulator
VAPGRRLAQAPAALRRLVQHPFPGNVRELRNEHERAALLTDGPVVSAQTVERALAFDRAPLGAGAAPQPAAGLGLGTGQAAATLRGIEDAALRAVLQASAGTRRQQALALGVSPRTLYRRLRALEQGRDPGA